VFAVIIEDVAMNLIGDNQNVVPDADFRQLGQFFAGENSASGVLWIAEDEGANIFADNLFFKSLEIEIEAPILPLDEWVLDAL